jgi:hypothetical protein
LATQIFEIFSCSKGFQRFTSEVFHLLHMANIGQLPALSRTHDSAPQQELDRKEQKKYAETQDVGPGDDTDKAPTNHNLSDSEISEIIQLYSAASC